MKTIRTFAIIALVLSSERVNQKDPENLPTQARRKHSSTPLKEPWHLKAVMGLLWVNAGVAAIHSCLARSGVLVEKAAGPVLVGVTILIVILAGVTTCACYNVRQAFNDATGDDVSFYAVEPLLEAGQHALKRVLTSGGVLFTLAISLLAIVAATSSGNNSAGDRIVALMIAASIFLLVTGAVSPLFDIWVAKAKHQARRDEANQ